MKMALCQSLVLNCNANIDSRLILGGVQRYQNEHTLADIALIKTLVKNMYGSSSIRVDTLTLLEKIKADHSRSC